MKKIRVIFIIIIQMETFSPKKMCIRFFLLEMTTSFFSSQILYQKIAYIVVIIDVGMLVEERGTEAPGRSITFLLSFAELLAAVRNICLLTYIHMYVCS